MGKNALGYGRDVKDLTGIRFGKLVVIKMHEKRSKKGEILWECKCDCGGDRLSISGALQHGGNKSCGCTRGGKTHGESGTRLMSIWRTMIARCHDSNSSGYFRYGAKGIRVCKEWRNNYFLFKDWALNNGYNDNLTIDRHPNQGGHYEPSNCRWATMKEQCENRRITPKYEIDGVIKTLNEWCSVYKISKSAAYQRITKLSWPVKVAFETPIIPLGERKHFKWNTQKS